MRAIKMSLSALTLGFLALTAGAPAQAIENGPTPTLANLKKDGPYAVTAQKIAGNGFGAGTIYVPNTAGQYAVVAVCPGFVSAEGSMTAISKRLATHGFVVVTIATNTLFDLPTSRATQLLAALKTVTAMNTGAVAGKMDTSRQVVSGWSMGGGGTLEAAASTPGLVAALAYAPWNVTATKYKTIKVPSAIIGATGDVVAPVSGHSQKFYDAIPTSTSKLLAVIQGSSHFFPNTAFEPASYTNISWMKRFADSDSRYGEFLNTKDAAEASLVSTGPF